jgi:vacuolar protein sorting-associated protein 41
MLKEIYEMKSPDDATDATSKAEHVFLSILTGWGPTSFLQEHIRHCKLDSRAEFGSDAIQDAERRFARRFTQTSAGYLSFPVVDNESGNYTIQCEGYFESKPALFDIDKVIDIVSPRAPLVTQMNSNTDASVETMREENARVALDAMARLQMMKGQYDAALKCFISIGALYSSRPLSVFTSGAVDFSESIGKRVIDKPWQSTNGVPFTFLLDIIDSHHLQQFLLDDNFLSDSRSKKVVPLFSLLQLVGFNAMGNFLIEHCVPPQENERINSDINGQERRGTLPIDLVADQLESSPRILHWYLHLVFTRKPEFYVRFPNTAYPPQSVTELHRRHFALYLDFAGEERDSAAALSGIEAYKVSGVETRLLKFLKVSATLNHFYPEAIDTAQSYFVQK